MQQIHRSKSGMLLERFDIAETSTTISDENVDMGIVTGIEATNVIAVKWQWYYLMEKA